MSGYYPFPQERRQMERRQTTRAPPSRMADFDLSPTSTSTDNHNSSNSYGSTIHRIEQTFRGQPPLNFGPWNDPLSTPELRAHQQSQMEFHQTPAGDSFQEQQRTAPPTSGFAERLFPSQDDSLFFSQAYPAPHNQLGGNTSTHSRSEFLDWADNALQTDSGFSQQAPLANLPPVPHHRGSRVPQLSHTSHPGARGSIPNATRFPHSAAFLQDQELTPDAQWPLRFAPDGTSNTQAEWSGEEDRFDFFVNPNALNDDHQGAGSFHEATPNPATPLVATPSNTAYTRPVLAPGARKIAIPRARARIAVDSGSRAGSSAPSQDLDAVVGAVKKRGSKSCKDSDKVPEQAPSLRPSGLYFSSLQHARQEVKGLRWDPRPDETLPTSQEEREAVVQELFDAMQDMSVFEDKKSSSVLKKRWLGEATPTDDKEGSKSDEEDESADVDDPATTQYIARDDVYKPWVKEKICWEIVETAERIYVEGTDFVSILDPATLRECEKWRHLTFRKRIDTLVKVCRKFKSRVDKMLRGGVIEEYVLCPGMLLRNSEMNRHHNDVRKDDITAGRQRAGRPSKAVATAAAGKRKLKDSDDDEPAVVKRVRFKRD
ncbi:uncharacterized protein K460DRAFT_356024 [Cucurbitaria berberidis CBS 394.84]|uniref:Uncharacterized protein n=1 Tax=Cucurbitaria berberidis CBS 394.84 TaxID=1168544 RepID=A0A9P4GHN2_9PLEO|nr:uncharacterized protein K460DRAFT_356024 [Cucurbitaria berberidis CBS 394.84]KAF1846333.1 hypothetical protein K460DRAFT_356024 [Cucurbitaria berberidis CBS 394.84]